LLKSCTGAFLLLKLLLRFQVR
ncbi:hypothetical protein KKC1_34380, partial [Calderihabitans maritimus]